MHKNLTASRDDSRTRVSLSGAPGQRIRDHARRHSRRLRAYEVPDLPVGSLGTRDIKLSGIRTSLDLAVGITEWLGLFGFGRGLLVTGVDRTSLLVDGASVEFVASGGVVVRLLKSEATGTQVALRAQGAYRDGREVTVQPLIRELVDEVSDTLAEVIEGRLGQLILVPTAETSLTGGAHAAQTILPFLSAQASVTFEHGWEDREPFILELDDRLTQAAKSSACSWLPRSRSTSR